MELAVQAHELRKTYSPAVTALDGVSLSVPKGTVYAVLGPNGAGKSTLTRVLSSLTRPDSGSATVCGVDVLAHPVAVRRMIGVVGQAHGADPAATGRENLVLQGEFQGLDGADLRRRIDRSLERFGLREVADRQVRTYSGGTQRRLDIAMGLLHDPRVLFLDEPTTGLDPEARAEMWTLVRSLARDEQMTVLLTTHYMEEADGLASGLAIIDHGRVVARGTPDELKRGLAGDTLEVQLAEPADGLDSARVASLPGVHDLVVSGTSLRARALDGGAALPAVLAALGATGAEVVSARVSRPTLDDVYLKYAGHAYAPEGDELAEVAA